MKIVGMVHLKALVGYAQHESLDAVRMAALQDARALSAGGVDAILLENTDDDPHTTEVGPEIVAQYALVARAVVEAVKVPVGICVLFNDYKASLAIAKAVGASFVRVPVFTEAIVAACGVIEGKPYDVLRYRRHIDASGIRILADVQVKHAAMLAARPIAESAAEAHHFGADELIITGRHTGDPAQLSDVQAVRRACPNARIVIGSGFSPEQLPALAPLIDSAIVGTYFKPNGFVEVARVKALMAAVRAA